jgi:anti-sigma regulatory factor (Ser/Thr protein kinase)
MDIYFQIRNNCSELTTIHAVLAKLKKRWNLTRRIIAELNLILDELVSNIIEHGNCDKEIEITIRLIKKENRITIILTDTGPPFDPTITPIPDISLPLEERTCGGLGIHLVRKFSDGCSYRRTGNKNVLTLKKHLPKENR